MINFISGRSLENKFSQSDSAAQHNFFLIRPSKTIKYRLSSYRWSRFQLNPKTVKAQDVLPARARWQHLEAIGRSIYGTKRKTHHACSRSVIWLSHGDGPGNALTIAAFAARKTKKLRSKPQLSLFPVTLRCLYRTLLTELRTSETATAAAALSLNHPF